MNSILIETKDKKEFSFIREMLWKLNVKMKIVKQDNEEFNEKTMKAFDEAEKKVLKKHKTVNSLMKDLKS